VRALRAFVVVVVVVVVVAREFFARRERARGDECVAYFFLRRECKSNIIK